MSTKILIAYESATGTTKEIAGIMADTIESSGELATIIPINQVRDIAPYEVVVIGAPINGMQYVESARTFIEDHREELKEKELHVFFTSYLIKAGRPFWQKKIVKSMQHLTQDLDPVDLVGFGGRVEQAFPKAAKWLFGVDQATPNDVTDFEEVRSYTKNLMSHR